MSPLMASNQALRLLQAASGDIDHQESAQLVVILSSILLGLVVLLLAILQLAAFRRRPRKLQDRPSHDDQQHPLLKGEVDPWQESARRFNEESDAQNLDDQGIT